jgi:hypothetical protein
VHCADDIVDQKLVDGKRCSASDSTEIQRNAIWSGRLLSGKKKKGEVRGMESKSARRFYSFWNFDVLESSRIT